MATKRTRSKKREGAEPTKPPSPGQRIPSKRFEGVYYRESKTRKHRGKPDRTYSYTLREAGRKKYINVGRASEKFTEEIAYQMRLDALSKINKGGTIETFSDKKKNTLDKIMTAYMDWRKVEGKHTAEDQSRYDRHIKPAFGTLPIGHITLARLDKFKADKLSVLSASSVKKLFILARAAINFAIARKLYKDINPFETRAGFAMPKEDNKGERFLTQKEAHDLLEELEKRSTQLYHMAFVSLYSGMRPTEIFGLKGADIDENNAVATITAKGGERETVPLLKQVLAVLKQYRTRPETLLFTDRNGNRFQDVPDTFGRAVDFLGLNNTGEYILDEKGERIPAKITDSRHRVRFHTFRHTYASWLAQSGKVDIYELMKLMRHKRIETTLRYAHLIPGEQRKKLTILDEFMPE